MKDERCYRIESEKDISQNKTKVGLKGFNYLIKKLKVLRQNKTKVGLKGNVIVSSEILKI